MTLTRRQVLASIGAVSVGLASPAIVRAAGSRTKLIVGTQDIAIQETVIASGVLDGLPFDLQWAVLPGPAAQLSGLYSKALDVGLMGDTSLIIEQGRAKLDWTEENAPLQIVAGWRNSDRAYPPVVTVVRNDAKINGLEDLRGRKWAYNFGGFNYLQYVLSRLKAGLKATDIQPVQLTDQFAAAAAFNAGRTDVYSGGLGAVHATVEKGDARILLISDELDIPSLTVFSARGDVIRDEAKAVALTEFLGRVRQHWEWFPSNLATVEKIYIEKLKQTPGDAKFFAANAASRFFPLNAELIRREQRIADVLFESGDLPKKIKVDIEFSQKFNNATSPAA
ncbi:PhnD/SsuA/transferrin family substrate-binding protein [Bradyrhizobium sp. dw_411]|uniref:PhnD/SsuA/transferrin family substrate-binding protein n=1 Tax=Bradyrhizobium sp. dw_411 TaxID=2720082 RepID=UPI001BCFCD24|nr:PhnD/SsuA/transferrin family substrate-binding protein [Bradyrhizobium sp. dw_411]